MSFVERTAPSPAAGSQIVVRSRSASKARPPSIHPGPPGPAGFGPPPGSAGWPPPGPGFKRLIVAADGTWLNSDNGMLNGEIAVPSNVTRITRAIKDVSREGIPQVVYYKFGIGSRGGPVGRIVQGAFGEGLDDNVRETYSFIATNYTPGDEIFLFGFSRGAFTVRTIAGLIDEIGLLTKKGLASLVDIHTDVKHRRDPDYTSKNPDVPFPNKPSAADPAYARELQRRGLTTLGIKIKVIGVWDTVGSLGIPRLGWLNRLGLQSATSRDETFYDTKLSNSVEHAFQALALDEKRSAFAPAIWEKDPDNTTILRQVWFPGEHSNCGGGNDDQELSNITLAWMIAQVQPFLDMRPAYVLEQADDNDMYYETHGRSIRPWSCGYIPNNMKGPFALGGGGTRTPGGYHAVNPRTGNNLPHLLRDTHEYIHASVRTRLYLNGPGLGDRGTWSAPALRENDWSMDISYNTSPLSDANGTLDAPIVVWKLPRDRAERGQHRVLPEAPLFEIERELCKRDPEAWGYVARPPPTKSARTRNKERKEERRRAENDGYTSAGAAGVGLAAGAGARSPSRHRRRHSRSRRDTLPSSSSPLPIRERETVERFHRRAASGAYPPRSPAPPGAFPGDPAPPRERRRARSVDIRQERLSFVDDTRPPSNAPIPPSSSRRDERRRERDRDRTSQRNRDRDRDRDRDRNFRDDGLLSPAPHPPPPPPPAPPSAMKGSRVGRRSAAGGPPSVDSWELEYEDDSAYVTNSPPPPGRGRGGGRGGRGWLGEGGGKGMGD